MSLIANNNQVQLNLPVWELCNQAVTASGATSALVTAEDGSSRYIYYLTASTFYRYDTYADSWQQLATPNVAPVTLVDLSYTLRRGVHGRVLSATSTSITIGGLRGPTLNGYNMELLRGTGLGQKKVLTYVSDNVLDFGVVTATSASALTDSTKKWAYNQWAGYSVAITYGTDATQYKEILYNDTTNLYISDANLQPHNHWDNQAYLANAPYALPISTAGSQTMYQIQSQTFSVTSWTTTPDDSSYFTVLSGGLYLFSSAAGAPYMTLQYYDILSDTWQSKTVPQSLIGAAFGTDVATEKGSTATTYISSTLTSASGRVVTDSGQTMAVDQYRNYRIKITGGTGVGQSRRICCNGVTYFNVQRAWDVEPDNTSTYIIYPDYNKYYIGGNGASAMFAYDPEEDVWLQGSDFDDGICTNISATITNSGGATNGWKPFGITTGTYIASGITVLNATPTAGGSGYLVGDILTCSVGGAGAKVLVTSINTSGAALSLTLVCSGTTTGYATGTGKATTGGTGSGCTIAITTVGVTCYVTTATNHFLQQGDYAAIQGCTISYYNTTFQILGVDSLTTFSIAAPSTTANMVASNSQSTTVIVDSSKSWTTNEHVGRLVHLCVTGLTPTSQIRYITANTATTLTMATIVAGVNGTSKYAIYDSKAFGHDSQFPTTTRQNEGHATSGGSTTLVDSTKNWVVNQWAGYLWYVEAGTGYATASAPISITSNTATTLTYSAPGFTPDATTHYVIRDTWGLMTSGSASTIVEATTKNWIVNQWAGKRVRIIAGTNLGQEATVVSNTATTLTTGAITAPDATSVYTILGIPVRSTGIDFIWAYGAPTPSLFYPRGGASNTMDIYNFNTEKWSYGLFLSPQQETFTTGSYYAYDGANIIYFTKSATGTNPRLYSYNTSTNVLTGGGQCPDLDAAATIGNRMEFVNVPGSGIQFLYLMQNTGTKIWRVLNWVNGQ